VRILVVEDDEDLLRSVSTAVVMLTARDEVADRVLGLDCGADDYLGAGSATASLKDDRPARPERHRARGSEMATRAPPSGLSATTMSPPYARATAALSARPIPVPS
jgi:hypothetical protein